MCGIAGIISLNQSPLSLSTVKRMTDTIAHRGPDGEGHWINEQQNIALGHRRLSIIDLSDSGAQPMHYLDRYTLVFNGEIYNYIELKTALVKAGYSFRSSSDTEVLLALYDQKGTACLSELDGMFAFAIWDQKEQVLFCARDRFGEKPFYYTLSNGQFLFASEIKALWAAGIPKVPDRETLFYYLHLGRVHHPFDRDRTFFEGVQKLTPAHYIKLDLKSGRKIDQFCYWTLPKNNEDLKVQLSETDIKEQFFSLFRLSVQRRLRSDVPVGSSLSGGLDSSAVVCMINDLNKGEQFSQNTFSARFPGFAKDEGIYMDMVLNHVKASPYFTYPAYDGFIAHFEKLCYHQDEPFGSASIYAQYEVMRLAKEKNVTVLLDGQGADEMLGGYSFYQETMRNAQMKLDRSDTETKKGLKSLAVKYLPIVYRYYTHQKRKKILAGIYAEQGYHPDLIDSAVDFRYVEERHDNLYEHLRHDLLNGNLEDLLRYADRNSMAHSREVRLPFLSHDLVELVMSLPDTYKIRDGWTKWIQRVSMAGLLPDAITWRKDKIGYEPPQKDWMESPDFKEMMYESKKILYQNHILTKSMTESAVGSVSANDINDRSWIFLMTAELFKNNS